MSFLGSIAAPLRRVLASYASDISVPVLLPCAGNFTVGAALRSGGYQGRIIGCDITLYTSALGSYLADKTLAAELREDMPEHLRGFLDLSTPARFAASVSLMLDLRQVWQCKYLWHRRVLSGYRENWPRLMDKTLEKLGAYHQHLAQGRGFDYVPMDAVKFLDAHGPDHAVFIDPPTFGSQDYIRQEKMLAASVTWQAPDYQEISFKDLEIYRKITSFREWMIVMERPLPDVEKLLGEPVAVVHKGRNSITYAYAGHSKKCVITRSYMASSSPGPIFPGDLKLTGREQPGVTLLSHKQTVRMNELFMSMRVDYALAAIILSLGLCLDKRIIGKLDFRISTLTWKLPPGYQIYQQSDLAVPSVEKRLSKLILLFAQSHEVKKLCDDAFKEDCRWTTTTAFSRNPVSMKYRGIYKLHKRLEGEGMEKYRLNYYAPLGQWSMQEAYDLWLKKYRK